MVNNYTFDRLVMHCALIEAFRLVVDTINKKVDNKMTSSLKEVYMW